MSVGDENGTHAAESEDLLAGRFALDKSSLSSSTWSTACADDMATGNRVRLRRLDNLNERQRQRLELLVRALSSIKHPNIQAPVGVIKDDDASVVISQDVESLPNSRSLAAEKFPMAGTQAWSILGGIAEGLDEIHRQGIAHGGLTPESVIVMDDGSVKLVGIGVSTLDPRPRSEQALDPEVPIEWWAPELAVGAPISPASDIYSLGLIASMMVTGEHPFSDLESADRLDAVRQRLASNAGTNTPKSGDRLADLSQLITRMLGADPEARPSAEEVVLEASKHMPRDARRRTVATATGMATDVAVRVSLRNAAEIDKLDAATTADQEHSAVRVQPVVAPVSADEYEYRVRSGRWIPGWTLIIALLAIGVIAFAVTRAIDGADKRFEREVKDAPSARLAAVAQSTSDVQAEATDALAATDETDQNAMRAVRRAGIKLEDGAQASHDEASRIEVKSAGDMQAKQAVLAYLRSQERLGIEMKKVPVDPRQLTSVSSQGVGVRGHELATVFIDVSVALESRKQTAPPEGPIEQLPAAAEHFMSLGRRADVNRLAKEQASLVAEIERRQKEAGAAAAKRQREALKELEKKLRDAERQSLGQAKTRFNGQITRLERRSNSAIARGHMAAKRSKKCPAKGMPGLQETIVERGQLLFLANTMIAPDRPSSARLTALQQRLAVSVGDDMKMGYQSPTSGIANPRCSILNQSGGKPG